MAERIQLTRRRQTSKPLLERQRRARINRSLEELKSLVLSALYHDNDQSFQKMEKAEILELTVNFLKMIREQQVTGYSVNQSDPESQSNYRAGFNDCAAKVCSFVENQPSVDSKLREQILESLTASYSYNIHTYQTRVNTNTSMCYSPGPTVYLSSLQTAGESPCSYASTPPPSPPSSAFSPYDRNEAAMLSEVSNNFIDNHSTSDIKRNIAEPCTNPVQCHLPLWRPWISSTQEGQI